MAMVRSPYGGFRAAALDQWSESRLDNWAFRNRPSADTTLGYSRFVRIMKVMLPLVACSLIVLVVVYSSLRREAGKVAITEPRSQRPVATTASS